MDVLLSRERDITKSRFVFRCTAAAAAILLFPATPVVAAGTKLGEFCASPTPQNKCMAVNRTDGYRVACNGGLHDEYLAEEWVGRRIKRRRKMVFDERVRTKRPFLLFRSIPAGRWMKQWLVFSYKTKIQS